jgi:hypothetical protein
MGVSVLAGGLAFVGTADAAELIVDGNFENTTASSKPIVKVGGKADPGLGGGWSTFSTYLYSTLYTMPGPANSGIQFLRPYPSGTYGIGQSSQSITQLVSLTASTTLTPAKIDSGLGRYRMSAWFSSYLTQGDNSSLTLEFLDGNNNLVGESVILGGPDFVSNIPTEANAKYPDAKLWMQDARDGTIPSGARSSRVVVAAADANTAPDGYVDLVSLDVVDAGLGTPAVASAVPGNNAVNVGPVVNIGVTLEDRVSSVNTNSIRLFLNSNLVTPTSIEKVETNTFVRFAAGLLPPLSTHTYSIAFADTGTPAVSQTNQFQFTVADYLTLRANLRTPLGSEDATKPGFNVDVWQVDSLVAPEPPQTASQLNLPASISFSEAVLSGSVLPNVADLTAAAQGNTFVVPGVIDWITSTGATANFAVNEPFPGIPGTSGAEVSFVDEIRTFVRFPAAGYYEMGVNNEDQFRLTTGTNRHAVLRIITPENSVPIPVVALGTNVTEIQFGGALPLTPLTGDIVYATPSGNPDDSCNLAGNAALAGKIVLLDRGGDDCDSAAKAAQAQSAGAIAVIMTTPGDIGFPLRLGDIRAGVTIPVLVIAEEFGGKTLKATLAAGTKVTAQISGDPATRIAEWDGPKGFGAVDVTFGFAVPEAGIYPLRLVAGQEAGNANLEWFTIRPDGTRILLNDTSNPAALRAFRARTESVESRLSVARVPTGVSISWAGAGTLEETGSLSAANWAPAASQANPQIVATSGGARFFRLRQ